MSGNGEKTIRVTALGATLSGKGRLLWNRWASKRPRVIIIDHTGEWRRNNFRASYASGLAQTLDVMEQNFGRESWRIVANLNYKEIGEFAKILIPEDDAWGSSPLVPIGGAAIYLPEVHQSLRPNTYDDTLLLWRAGRHVLLDVFADTQSPSSTSKEVLKNCQIIAVLNLHYKRDLAVVEEYTTSREQFAQVVRWIRQPYHAALIMPEVGRIVFAKPGAEKLAP